MTNTLKIVAWNVNGESFSKTKYEDVPKDERDNNSWWYLHGKLEDEVGFDKAFATNCKSAGYSKETLDWSSIKGNQVTEVFSETPRLCIYANGEIPVEVEGIDKPCIGFFWTTEEKEIFWKYKSYPYWSQRGLVCFADDEKACEYARKKMKEKSNFI